VREEVLVWVKTVNRIQLRVEICLIVRAVEGKQGQVTEDVPQQAALVAKKEKDEH